MRVIFTRPTCHDSRRSLSDMRALSRIPRRHSKPSAAKEATTPASQLAEPLQRRVLAHLDQHLAEIVAAEHLGEAGGDGLETLADVLAIFHLARGDAGRDLAQEGVVVI